MAPTFEGPAWKTGNSLVVTLPGWLVKGLGCSGGELLEVSIERPAFTINLTPWTHSHDAMAIGVTDFRKFKDFFPERGENFLVEADGHVGTHHLTNALTVSGFGRFLRDHPKLARVRWRVVEPKESFRLEYDESWT